jgi:hypothetical protein
MLDDYYEQPETVYSFLTENLTFALTKTREDVSCGCTFIKTQHPNLLVLDGKNGHAFGTRRKLSTEYVDILAYVDSKHAYVERHTRTQMNALYRDVAQQRCTLERQLSKGALSLTVNSLDEFAYVMKGPDTRPLFAVKLYTLSNVLR